MKSKFKKMLIALAQNFNHELSEERLEGLTRLAETTVGFDHDWEQVTKVIALNEQYFPTLATIRKYLGNIPSQFQTPLEKATLVVDRFIQFLTGALSYEEISRSDLRYCKDRFCVDRYAFQRGQVNLDFKRREWIQMVLNDFTTGAEQLQLASGFSSELPQPERELLV